MTTLRTARLLAGVGTLILLAAACPTAGEPAVSPSPSPTRPATTPSPTPEAVRGHLTLVVDAADPGPIVFHDRPEPEPDGAAVEALAGQVTEWLDAHLTDLQAGGDGLLGDVAAPGLLTGASSDAVGAVTSGLASPGRPVAAAQYHVVVVHDGQPRYARATIAVRSSSGRVARGAFVFVDRGELRLVATGPDDPE